MTNHVKGCFLFFYSLIYFKKPHMRSSPNYFFFSITFAWGKIRNVTKTKLFFIQKQRGYLFACCGGNQPRKNFTGNYKHPLINLIRLSVKDTQENTEGQVSGGERQSRVKFSAAEEWEAARMVFSGSSLQAPSKAELKQARDDSPHEGEGINWDCLGSVHSQLLPVEAAEV